LTVEIEKNRRTDLCGYAKVYLRKL